MRVFHVNVVRDTGSTGRITSGVHQLAAYRGHESRIAFGRGPMTHDGSGYKIGGRLDFYLHGIGTRVFDSHGFWSKAATLRLIQEMVAFRPDVIHLHNIHGYYLHVGVLFEYLKKSAIPVVWTLHDCWAFTGHCAHFEFANCDRWRSHCYSCPAKSEYPRAIIFDRSRKNFRLKNASFVGVDNMHIVTPSRWLASKVGSSFLQCYPVHVINNGIDLEAFSPEGNDFRKELGIADHFVVLAVASPFTERKGYDTLLRLAKNLHADEVLVLVGLTAAQVRSLPGQIIGVPRTSSVRELARFYRSADVFVNATQEDTYPTVNLEALSCGVPVVTFDSGGSRETINDSVGLLIEDKSDSALLAGLRSVKSNGKAQYSASCVEFAQLKCDRNERLGEYVDLYESLCT